MGFYITTFLIGGLGSGALAKTPETKQADTDEVGKARREGNSLKTTDGVDNEARFRPGSVSGYVITQPG